VNEICKKALADRENISAARHACRGMAYPPSHSSNAQQRNRLRGHLITRLHERVLPTPGGGGMNPTGCPTRGVSSVGAMGLLSEAAGVEVCRPAAEALQIGRRTLRL
jgi:hypothetical protein